METEQTLPDWSLCIATLNRRATLLRTLEFAAHQTCPPRQIVVVDVSDDWQDTRAAAERCLAPWPEIALDYRTSEIRSSATQRNEGIARCQHDIVFILDDDSFLYPTSAEEILKVYAADKAGEVAAICAKLVPGLPPEPESAGGGGKDLPARKASGRRRGEPWKKRLLRTSAGKWVYRNILLQSKEELFIRYDEPRRRYVPRSLASFKVKPVTFMPGSAMTVRRSIAKAEPFDTALRFYAAFEDLDVAYRHGRHGAILRAERAHLHHYEAEGGRLKRKKLVIFQLLNMLVFLKRHAADPDQFLPTYRRLLRRRLLGETLKDIFSGRFALPQGRGVITVMRTWREVWRGDTGTLDQWYPEIQERVLNDLA